MIQDIAQVKQALLSMYLLMQTVHLTIDSPQLLKSDKRDDGGRCSADQGRSESFEHPSRAFVLEGALKHDGHTVS